MNTDFLVAGMNASTVLIRMALILGSIKYPEATSNAASRVKAPTELLLGG
jgi:hypothetical protein